MSLSHGTTIPQNPEVELIWLYSGDEITSADSLDEYSWLHLIADKAAIGALQHSVVERHVLDLEGR